MKKPFLVVYDYGQGGMWAFVIARSRSEIERRFPELEIVEKPPEWVSLAERKRLKEEMTFDVDQPQAFLASLAGGGTPRDASAP